jgi:hypothetical protein
LGKAITGAGRADSRSEIAMSEDTEYITIADARAILRVSKPRMADLLREGTLVAEENPLDRRSKLVKRADVEALARRAGRLGKVSGQPGEP